MEQARFNAYRDLHREVKQLRRQLQNVEELIYSPRGQRFTSMPTAAHGKGNTMENIIVGHIELEETFNAKAAELTQELLTLEKAVESLVCPIERAVMRYRYFEGWPWQKIADKLNYSKPQMHRYHGSALENLKYYETGRPVEVAESTHGEDCDDPCTDCEDDCEECDYFSQFDPRE